LAKPRLLVDLEEERDKFITNLGRIPQFVRFVDFPPHYWDRAEILDGLTSDDIRGWSYTFTDMRPYVEKYGPRNGYWRWFKSLRPKLQQLLYQQLLVFMVTSFEVYMEEVARAVLRHEPRCLSSEKTLTWKEVFELGSYQSIVDYLISKQIDGTFHANWAKIIEMYMMLFKIDLSNLIDHLSMVELFEIRHVIVHNLGIVDNKFSSEVKSSKWGIQYQATEAIRLDERVLQQITSFLIFSSYAIQKKLSAQFVLRNIVKTDVETGSDEEIALVHACTPDKCPFCGGNETNNVFLLLLCWTVRKKDIGWNLCVYHVKSYTNLTV